MQISLDDREPRSLTPHSVERSFTPFYRLRLHTYPPRILPRKRTFQAGRQWAHLRTQYTTSTLNPQRLSAPSQGRYIQAQAIFPGAQRPRSGGSSFGTDGKRSRVWRLTLIGVRNSCRPFKVRPILSPFCRTSICTSRSIVDDGMSAELEQ